MHDRKAVQLESSVPAHRPPLPAQADRLDSLERENAHLRAIAQNVLCVYGHRKEGSCELGYPGCACMDDLIALTGWMPDSPLDPVIRLQDRVTVVELRLLKARELLRMTVRYLQSTAEGFDAERIPSKASGARAMADMLEAAL